LEINEYLASMAALFFIYIIIWYVTQNAWLPDAFLGPVGQVLGLLALILTAIFVISQIRER
jgi:hypothetical protein